MQNRSEYNNHLEWKKANPKDYQQAVKGKYLRKICKHFSWPPPRDAKPRDYWTKERVFDTLKGYNYFNDWVRDYCGAHNAARINGWVEEIDRHMKWDYTIKVTKLGCINSYKEHGENWDTKGGVYYKGAKRNGWIYEITGGNYFF